MTDVKPKPRRFDFYPDDFIAGVGELTLAERGLLWTHASLQYSRGGDAVAPEHLRRQCPDDARVYNRSLARLLTLSKLQLTDDGKLTQKRCVTEAENARKRLITSAENGRKGGRPFNKNNEVAKPAGFSRAREGVAKTITNTFREEKGDDELGRCAPSDAAAVTELVAEATRVLSRPVIRDPQAYDT